MFHYGTYNLTMIVHNSFPFCCKSEKSDKRRKETTRWQLCLKFCTEFEPCMWRWQFVNNVSAIRSRDNLSAQRQNSQQGWQWWQSRTMPTWRSCLRDRQSPCGIAGTQSTMRTRWRAQSYGPRTMRTCQYARSWTKTRPTGFVQWQEMSTIDSLGTMRRSQCSMAIFGRAEDGSKWSSCRQWRNQFNGWLTTSRRDTQWVVKKQSLWQSPWMTTTCATIWRWERCPRFSVDTRYKCYKSTRHTSTSSPWRNRITSEWSSWATMLQTSSRSTNGPMAGSGCMATQCTLRRWCRSRVRTIIRQFSTWPSTTWVNTVRAACHKQYNSASRTTRLQTESTPSMWRFQDANKRGMKIMHNMSKRRQWWSRKRGLMRRP